MALTLAISLALSACARDQGDPAATDADADPGAAPTLALDETTLPPVNRFQLSDLDAEADACRDFNAFANGTWLAANPIPGDRSSWGAFEMLDERSTAVQRQLAEQSAANADATGPQKLVGDFWATGMDAEKINAQGIEPLREELAEIDALADGPAVADYLRRSAAKGGGFLVGIGAMPDFQDATVNIAATGQGGLGLPDAPYYTAEDKQKIRDAYVAHIAKVLELSDVPAADAATQAADVMAFETRLASVSKSREQFSRDVGLYYNPVTPAEADALSPNFPFTAFFESQGVEVPETFSLSVPEYHAEVSTMLAEVPVEQWKSYLRFHLVDEASPFLSDAFVEQNHAFYGRTLGGQQELKERGKRVLQTIDRSAGEALGQLYVKVAFPPESKARMEELIGNLSDALKVRIENLEWMSEETKARALEKWETFEPRVGYPDKWRDWSGLATGRDSYIGNVLAAREFNHRWDIGKIGQPVDRSEWGMRPQTVNASYNPLANQLTFPAAILQPPFFDPEADDPLNYGGIGAVIGHEMTHGYDDQGARFDPQGNMVNWWTEADLEGFKARTGKLVTQFDAYTTEDGRNLNGNHTLGENIADLGGLATAYDAMKTATDGAEDPVIDGLTRDQRFFLGWATVWRRNFTGEELDRRLQTDEHALAGFRAIGAPSNLPAFAAAFDCKPGDPMVRGGDEQVVIW
ncbi:peptidase [Luteimonas sp. SJ-92]|uniref:Peptidase n=1 Tax=Luteimonas salinisoli TaxID=2752307 RepID=A0A853JFF7_9GAMM|nr:peptidase [Luteimonas salinisoli]